MKKLVPFIIALLVIAGGAAAYFATKKDNKNTSAINAPASQPAASDTNLASKKACDIFTLDDAKKVLGTSAEAGDSNKDNPTESDDLLVSTCAYSDGSSALGQTKSASVLVRSAKTAKGAASNKSQFGAQKPAGTQDVSGYGDAAFWNPSFGQLNVLKNNNWYIISNGTLKVAERTVDQAKELADLISSKF